MEMVAKVALAAPVVAAVVLLGSRLVGPQDQVEGARVEATVEATALDPEAADPTRIQGRASVIDGDTIEVAGQRIRLHGIDAPESSQMCDANGTSVRCGQRAAFALSDFLGQRPVVCEPLDIDRYGRTVARCLSDGRDIAQFMVADGWATAYRRYSTDYVTAEGEARDARRGIWGSEFVRPEDYRRGHRGGS